jgi:tRNA-specific 2-thiouridylase
MTKGEVRGHATRLGLKVAEKAESQDICFVPDGDYVRFLEEQRGAGAMNGDIVHVGGKHLGKHLGTYRYTIGQRRGLGLSWPQPLYVVGIDAENRKIIVGEKEHLAATQCHVVDINWLIDVPARQIEAGCRIRYRHHEVSSLITILDDGSARVVFQEPQSGVTPGQAAVFYDGDLVLGGGSIK